MSRTVSMPAKTDFSLFQRGAETTPENKDEEQRDLDTGILTI